MIALDTPIIILHGLGNRAWTLFLFEVFLNYYGYTNVYRPLYDADQIPSQSSAQLNDILLTHFNGTQNSSIVLVGNSMGGVVAMEMWRFGWDIKLAITINSPLNGASLLRQIDVMTPAKLVEVCGGNSPAYMWLRYVTELPCPPHPYKTISTNLPFINFDGMVYESDAKLEEYHHHVIPWGFHHTIVLDPRVYFKILSLLQE